MDPLVLCTGPITITGATLEEIRHTVRAEMRAQLLPLRGLIVSQFSDLRDSLAGSFSDMSALIAQLQASVDSANSATHLADEDQATFDQIKATADAMRAALPDADGDGNPAAPVEPAPVDEEPATEPETFSAE